MQANNVPYSLSFDNRTDQTFRVRTIQSNPQGLTIPNPHPLQLNTANSQVTLQWTYDPQVANQTAGSILIEWLNPTTAQPSGRFVGIQIQQPVGAAANRVTATIGVGQTEITDRLEQKAHTQQGVLEWSEAIEFLADGFYIATVQSQNNHTHVELSITDFH